MPSVGEILWFVFLALLLIFCLAAIYFVVRLRMRTNRIGTFECAYRRDQSAGWTAGVAHYAEDRLDWYRLVSMRLGADRSWLRHRLEIRSVQSRSDDPESAVIDLYCEYQGSRFILALYRSDYNALVSWLEGSPPHAKAFF